MNPSFLRLITVFGLLFHFSCSTAGEWGKDVKRIVLPFGLSANQLPDPQTKGAALFASYCSQCHNLPSPRMHSTGDWPMRFEKMMDHALLMAGTSPAFKIPADKEKTEIVSYLEKNGFRELPANSPLRGEPQVFNIIWFCSVCHAVPDPDQFPAKEWGKIVDRMNSYRKKQGRDEMNNTDRKAVMNFLTKKQQ
ncbi:MAG: hypothetical protein Q7T21_06510 [Gallionella sp.]|nr:hypothetical protein [Gallionella sp.]